MIKQLTTREESKKSMDESIATRERKTYIPQALAGYRSCEGGNERLQSPRQTESNAHPQV